MSTKTCSRCQEEKHVDCFPIQRRRYKGSKQQSSVRRSECKECYNAYMREYLKDNNKHKKRVHNHKIEKSKFVQEHKLEKGCMICGYNKCKTSLHYHHLDPKNKNFEVSWGASRGRKMEDIQKEIDKCAIVCANCHGEIEEGIIEI